MVITRYLRLRGTKPNPTSEWRWVLLAEFLSRERRSTLTSGDDR